MNKRTIVLDPGHGGVDSGAISDDFDGVYEKTSALEILLKVKEFLTSRKFDGLMSMTGFEPVEFIVHMTRETDRFVSLTDRVQFSNLLMTDLFVSLHHNSRPPALPETKVFDLEAFVCPTSPAAGGTAAKFCLLQVGRMLGSIMIPFKDKGVVEAGFQVIKYTHAPSCLLELGYMVDKEDATMLRHYGFQRTLADGIGRGILEHFGLFE